jgi:CheY-like chemotaxis protein
METVLVLEDEPTNLKVIALVMSLDGYRVLEAADGNAALGICKQHRSRIHLLVADIQLPGISGTQVAIQILKCWPELAILFTSGTPLKHWAAADLVGLKQLSEASVDILEKPFTPLALGHKVHELLSRERQAGCIPA